MNVKLPFGIRNGILVHISEITLEEKGLACNCFCPNCNEPLIAKKGEVKIHHFAHSKSNCSTEDAMKKAFEYLLKETILKSGYFELPEYTLSYNKNITKVENISDNKVEINLTETEVVRKRGFISIDKVDIKEKDNLTEIVIEGNDEKIIIQLILKNFEIIQKFNFNKEEGISVLQIDLRKYYDKFNLLDKKTLEDILINEIKNKKWVFSQNAENIKNEIVDKNFNRMYGKKDAIVRERLLMQEALIEKAKNPLGTTVSIHNPFGNNSSLTSLYWFDSEGNKWAECTNCGKFTKELSILNPNLNIYKCTNCCSNGK